MVQDNNGKDNGNNQKPLEIDISLDDQFVGDDNGSKTPTPPPTPPSEEKKEPTGVALGDNIIDSQGRLVDSVGNVLLSKEDVEAKLGIKTPSLEGEDDKATPEDSDNSEYTVDAQGNLLKDGTPFKKKGEFTVNENNEITFEEEDDSVIKNIIEKAKAEGFELLGEDGNPMTFEDTDEGLLQMAKVIGDEQFNKQIQEFFTGYPVVAKIVSHLSAGGQIEDFLTNYATQKDYTKLEIPADNKEGRKDVIKEYLSKVANNTPSTIDYMLKAIEASGDTDVQYEHALQQLKTWQVQQETAKQEAQAQAQAQEQQRIVEHWNSVKAVITKGNLGEFAVNDTEKDDFFAFIAHKADKQGNTQSALKYANLPIEKKLMMDYLLFKDFNLDSLVKAKAAQEKVLSLKGKKLKTLTISKNPGVQRVGAGIDISLDNIS